MLLRAVLCSSCGSDGVCVEDHRRIRSTVVDGGASTRMGGGQWPGGLSLGARRDAWPLLNRTEFPAGNSGGKVKDTSSSAEIGRCAVGVVLAGEPVRCFCAPCCPTAASAWKTTGG